MGLGLRSTLNQGVVVAFFAAGLVIAIGAALAAKAQTVGSPGAGVQAEPPVQLAQNEFRRRFVPVEEPTPGADRWIEAPGAGAGNQGSQGAQGSQDGQAEDVGEPAPINAPILATPEPRRVPISPAARAQKAGKPLCDIPTCAARYQSFTPADCTYQPYYGPREVCRRGNPNSPSAIAAWRRLATAQNVARDTKRQEAAQMAAAREALARSGAESEAARAAANKLPRRASASVSADADALLDWFDLIVLGLFAGFCLFAFVRLWSPPERGPV